MKANHVESIAFLRWWLPDGPWCLAAIHPAERDRKDYIKSKVFKASRTDEDDREVMDWLEKHADHNLYYTANIAKPRAEWAGSRTDRPTRENLAALNCLHADVDPRVGEDPEVEQERILKLLSTGKPRDLPEPTAIVFSGGGYQALWKLDVPVPIGSEEEADKLARYNLQIRNLLEGDNAQDVSRILRLPGTINWPNKAKTKKGRKPTLAKIVERHPERRYSLKDFIPAPDLDTDEKTTGRPKRKTRAIAQIDDKNVKRFEDVDDIPGNVPDDTKIVIVQGDDPDDSTRFNGDRSAAVWYVCCELVRQKVPDQDIFSVITDPDFGISAHVLQQPRAEKYALRQIERAHEFAIDADLRELNDAYAVIENYGGRCRVVRESWDEGLERYVLMSYTFDDFRNSLLNRQKQLADDKRMPLAEWWLRHEHRRQYDRVVFRPNEDDEVDGHYNLWRGFGVDPAPGDCSLFLAHVRDTLCGGDEASYNYLLRWMAYAVQFPQLPGQIAVVLKGRMGTGKSTFAQVFGRLFGRHYLQVNDSKRLTGNFNAHLRECVLLFADEAFYAGDKKHESSLKAMITERTMAVEAKGRDTEMSANCLHLIMASNDEWAVPASMDDRRFFILDVKDDRRNAHRHFAKLHDQMENGGYSALLDTLLRMDLTGFNVRERPETKALANEKEMNLDPVSSYWYESLRNGTLGLLDRRDSEWPEKVPKAQVFDEIRRRNPAHRWKNNITLGKLLSKIIPPECSETRIAGAVTWRNPQGQELTVENATAYRLAPLARCRDFWEQRVGPPHHPWPSTDVETSEPKKEPF